MRSVLVTGASSGIGRETALLLDGAGERVFAGVRKESDAESLRGAGSERLEPVFLEVTDEGSIDEAVAQIRGVLGPEGRMMGLVNNAGIAVSGPLEFVDLESLRYQFDVNVFGVAAVTRAFLPLLSRPGGRVVNISSGAGRIVTPLIGPYCASKYALEAMSDALRVEVRGQGLLVSVVEPGFIETSIHEKNDLQARQALEDLPPEGKALYGPAMERLIEMTAKMGKNATPPRRVAEVVVKALQARRPKTRYPVTAEAHLLAWLGPFLGDRVRDAIFGRLVGL